MNWQNLIPLRQTRFWRYLALISVIAVAYLITAQLTVSTLKLGVEASPLWPPAGVALAAVLLQGQRIWLGVALGAFFFCQSQVSWTIACGLAFGITLQAVLGAELLRRMSFRLSLERVQDVLQLVVLGVLVSPVVNATISTLVGYLSNTITHPTWQENWRIIWLGDGMGILVVTPLLLVLNPLILNFRLPILARRILGKTRSFSKQRSFAVVPNPTFPTPFIKEETGEKISQQTEAVVCFTLLCAVSWFVFSLTTGVGIARYPLEYLPFPFVVWAALRFAQRGAVMAMLIVFVTAIWGVVHQVGPFVAKAGDLYQAILFLHGFTGVVTIMALVLAAAESERAFAVALLKEQEASLANAQRLARLGHWDFVQRQQSTCLPDQQLRWSDELYRIFGFAPKAFNPSWEAFFKVVHPADRERVGQAIRGALRENKPYCLEYRIVLPDDSERVVCEQSEINKNGISGTVQDITDRQQVEAQLRAAAERNRLLGEMSLRIRRSLNLDQILNTTVAEVRQFLGADRVFIGQIDNVTRNPGTSIGLVIAEAVDPCYPSVRSMIIDDEMILQAWRSQFEQSRAVVVEDIDTIAFSPKIEAYHCEYQVRAILGVPIWVGNELYGALVVNQCEQPRLWQSWEIDWLTALATQLAIAIQQAELYRQITDFAAHLESLVEDRTQELSAKMTELQELNHLKDVFLQAVSHDLRTSLLGMSMVLNNLYNSSGETVTLSRPLLERMLTSSERQLNLINSLLEDHFNEKPQLDLHCKPVQLDKLIQKLIADYSPMLSQNKATLTPRIPADCSLLAADPKQLRRVLENLLTNALKHNPPGLNLTLEITVEDQMIRCTLQDNGVGMSQDQQNSLFKLYIRGLHTNHLTGIGLGLYQCRQIINAHGGEIGVISAPQAGSTFWFTLPLAGAALLECDQLALSNR